MTVNATRPVSRTFALAVLVPLVFVVLATFCAVAVVLDFAARSSDADALVREETLFAGAIARAIEDITWQQESVTVWDMTIERLRVMDMDWLDENPGVWMHEYFGIDRVFILDAAGAPIYGMMAGERTSPEGYFAHLPLLSPIVSQLRNASADGATSLSDVVVMENRPALIGASLVVTDSGDLEQEPGSEFLHLAIRFMDTDFLTDIAERTQVAAPRFTWTASVDAKEGVHSLADRAGAPIGYFAWTADRPGARLMRQTSPVLGVAAFLLAAVAWTMARRLYRTTSALEASEAQSKHTAFHDGLTGLANRSRFNLDLQAALRRVKAGERIALIYLDLDRFKYVNDTFGHQAGDTLIVAFARRLSEIVRKTDNVARLGGDEFAIIQAEVSGDPDIEALCERVLATVSAPFDVGGNATHVGVSIGVAVAPDEGVDASDLARKADIALYAAKSGGRNRFCVFAEEMDHALRNRQEIERDLRRALERGGEIGVLFQPIVERDRLAIVGMEALVRWDHPLRGPIPPCEFIPVAEETGLIVPLGEFVLRRALQAAAEIDGLTIAVNVSAVQIQSASFPESVKALIAESGVEPGRVELEITETILMDGHERSMSAIARLQEIGVRIALDDFGTGYSSLAYLRSFAVDRIKIDRAFIANLATDRGATEIVGAIAALGKALGMRVTAEGVETREQFDLLSDAGCDEFQGFLFSPPVPAATMAAFAGGRPLPAPGTRAALGAA